MSIGVAWIGHGLEPGPLVGGAAAALAREFGAHAVRLRLGPAPHDGYDAVRRQHSSRAMLGWLAAQAVEDGSRLLGVTDVDLFIPVLTFVFGEAQLRGRAAVVSVARLVERAPPGLARARVMKEAVHEVGHTYGLVHCATPTCVMARSAALVSVDLKSDRLCAGCRARYRELQEQSRVPVHSPDPDRR